MGNSNENSMRRRMYSTITPEMLLLAWQFYPPGLSDVRPSGIFGANIVLR